MQLYKEPITGKLFHRLPKPWRQDNKVIMGLNDNNMGSHGWTMEEVQEPDTITPLNTYENLNPACTLFRQVCGEISSLLNIEGFKGGFDELLSLTEEQQISLRTSGLSDKLNLVDRWCNHEANKVGLQAPAWWYRCWEVED